MMVPVESPNLSITRHRDYVHILYSQWLFVIPYQLPHTRAKTQSLNCDGLGLMGDDEGTIAG